MQRKNKLFERMNENQKKEYKIDSNGIVWDRDREIGNINLKINRKTNETEMKIGYSNILSKYKSYLNSIGE